MHPFFIGCNARRGGSVRPSGRPQPSITKKIKEEVILKIRKKDKDIMDISLLSSILRSYLTKRLTLSPEQL
jgi:hypothetical protein